MAAPQCPQQLDGENVSRVSRDHDEWLTLLSHFPERTKAEDPGYNIRKGGWQGEEAIQTH